jgi:hypothetical protein
MAFRGLKIYLGSALFQLKILTVSISSENWKKCGVAVLYKIVLALSVEELAHIYLSHLAIFTSLLSYVSPASP